MREQEEFATPIERIAKVIVDWAERPKPERIRQSLMTQETKNAIMSHAVAACCAKAGYGSLETYELLHPDASNERSV